MIEHDWNEDGRCGRCNAERGREDHIPCALRPASGQTDREDLELEALALLAELLDQGFFEAAYARFEETAGDGDTVSALQERAKALLSLRATEEKPR